MGKSATVSQELTVEAQKAGLELIKLRNETSWVAFVSPLAVSIVTSLAAITGLFLSVYSQSRDVNIRRQEDEDRAVQAAITLATDPVGGVDRKLAGLSMAAKFWPSDRQEGTISSAAAAILVSPGIDATSARLRCGAADVLGSAIQDSDAAGARNAERGSRIARLLYGDSSGALGLISHQNYLLRIAAPKLIGIKDAAEIRDCSTAIGATVAATRKNWENLRGANLQWNDLSFGPFYESDLHGAMLYGTRLRLTDFTCANLSQADMRQFRPADNPHLDLANVHATTKYFRAIALANGAVDISDADWLIWRRERFSATTIRTMVSADTWTRIKMRRQNAGKSLLNMCS